MLHRTRWTLQKIAQRLALIEPLVYRRQRPLPDWRYHVLDGPLAPPPVQPEVDDSDWLVITPEQYWGKWGVTFVLRNEFEVPEAWPNAEPVALFLPLGDAGSFTHPEALAYVDGQPYATCDRYHREILLPEKWRDARPHTLALHGWVGHGEFFPGDTPAKLLMGQPRLVQIDTALRDFVAAVRVTLGVVAALKDDDTAAKGPLLNGLDAAFKIVDTREPFGERFYDSIPAAHQALNQAIAAAGPPLDVDIYAAGHAHIDVAWLWTVAQTRRKAGRTFYNVLRLMEQFPNYRFTQSQPQLYEFVRQDYPQLFAAIQERVAEGRWEPIGGMWVEADCNLTGAESLARQLMLGRQFYREHFGTGVASPILWLPDVFGYAWNLPQLMKQSNLDYFFTIKIGWSQYNRLPFESFWWQGLDGTRVLTHFSPTPESDGRHTGTYNAEATPRDVVATWENFQQKEQSRTLLMAFGYGDGGGGPTREMLENISAMRAFPDAPKVRHATAVSFFRRLEEEAGAELPVWKGELYLEYHRGTYTTQSRMKRANRKAEFLLHDAEFVAAYAARLDPAYTYPHQALQQAWQVLCLNQFHDIIPGSSIREVYEEALRQAAEIRQMGSAVRDAAMQVIARQVGGDLLVINPTSFVRRDLAFWRDGDPSMGQPVTDGVLLDVDPLPPYSVMRLDGGRRFTPPQAQLEVTPSRLENEFLRVELNEAGDVTRIYDKQKEREVLAPGMVGNVFQAFEDRPLFWDAWDIDIFYDDKMWLAEPAHKIEVVEEGPLRATVAVHRRILNSDYTQYISLMYNSPRLDFNTTIDWRERHILLKVAFPVNLLAPNATYDIQWGNVERPTHRNTSWDWARFESVAHKWVDVSEGDYGVSLLNDCKYGHDVQDIAEGSTRLRLSLLRSPTVPDPEADQGIHHFVYSLLPHDGRWGEETVAQAYALNDPLLVYAPEPNTTAARGDAAAGAPTSFVTVDKAHVVIETVKAAEDGDGTIVRLYENQRCRGPVRLCANFPFTKAWRTNLLEDNQEQLKVNDGEVHFDIKPYEIVTLRLC